MFMKAQKKIFTGLWVIGEPFNNICNSICTTSLHSVKKFSKNLNDFFVNHKWKTGKSTFLEKIYSVENFFNIWKIIFTFATEGYLYIVRCYYYLILKSLRDLDQREKIYYYSRGKHTAPQGISFTWLDFR